MDELTQHTADFLKILSDPVRLDIINILKRDKKSAKEIEEILGLSQSYTSQQLKLLTKAQILTYIKVDNVRNYFIKNKNIYRVITVVHSFILEMEKDKFQKLVSLDNIDKLF